MLQCSRDQWEFFEHGQYNNDAEPSLLADNLVANHLLCALSAILGQEAVEAPVVEDTKLEWKSNQTWPTDEIELRDGRIFKGLILNETDETIVMDEVRRSPGKTMYLIKRRFPTSTVLHIDRIPTQIAQY